MENEEKVKISNFITDNFMIEQIYKPKENVSLFIKYNLKSGILEEVKEFEHEGIVYVPINDEELVEEVVVLPTGYKLYANENQLDEKIYTFITKWLDVDELFKFNAINNIKYYWVYDKFETVNYLRALGDTGCGKSRFLNVFGHISYKSIFSSGASTVSPVFRMIEKWRGTLITDEHDIKKSDETNDYVKLLNIGYERRMSKLLRCDMNDKEKVRFFQTFCPKIIATRKRFDDKATEARCVTNIMRQTNRKDIPFNLNEDFFKEAEELRNMLLYYRLINYHLINVKFIDNINIKTRLDKYEPRIRQVNSPLINLFYHDKHKLENFFKYMDILQKSIIEEREDSFDGWIVGSIATLICRTVSNITGHLYITAQDIEQELKQMENRQYDYNIRGIGKHLKNLGFVTKPTRVDGKTKRIIFWQNSDFDIFERYISDLDQKKLLMERLRNVTSVTSVTSHTEDVDTSRYMKTTHKTCHVINVTHVTPNIPKETKVYSNENIVSRTQLKEFIEQNPKQNVDLILEKFGNDMISRLLREGDIYETPKGTYKVL